MDVVLNNLDSKPALLRNVVLNGNRRLTLKLIAVQKVQKTRSEQEFL